jgi:hypothetical protein
LVGKPEENGRPRYRLEDNIKIYLIKLGWDSVDWIQLAQVGVQWWVLVNTVKNLRVLAGNLLTS